MKICFIGWGNSIHMQRWMRWFVDNKHNVYLVTDQPSGMAGITEYDIFTRDHYVGSRINRYIRFEFNMYYLRLASKILKIDLVKKILMVRRIIANIKPDILHLHTFLYPSYLGVFSNFRPLVVTPWNGDIVWKYQWSFIRKYVVRYGLSKADLITVDSDELRVKVLKFGEYDNKIANISFGVDTKLFHPEAKSKELRKRLRIDADTPVVISNRSLEDIFNIDIIIKAIPLVLSYLPKTVFLFTWHSAGRKDYMMKLAEDLGIMSQIRFVGGTDHSELPHYYAEADVAVSIPSSDTISISLLEAMACGVPPVVTDLPSIREVITDGINGCVVPLRNSEATAQAIIKLLEDRDLRESFAQRNREWVAQNVDWNINMGKAEELYYALVRKKKLGIVGKRLAYENSQSQNRAR